MTASSNLPTAPGFTPSQRAMWAEGQPISDLMSRALANPNLISLAAGFVDQQTLPVEVTQTALDSLLSDPVAGRAALQYGTTPGYLPLREALVERFQRVDCQGRVTGISPDQVVVTAGSNQLLHLVLESLVDPGDLVLCAAPTYLVFLGTVNNTGAESVGIASDEDGMIPAALVDELDRLQQRGELSRVKAIYLVPDFDNPCGITTAEPRRAEIVEIARRYSRQHHIHVIADAAYSDLRYWGEDQASCRCFDEDGETVVVAGTFSKSFSPGIRVGWGILPPHLVEPVCNQKGNIDFGSPNFSQLLMARVMELNLFDEHIATLRSHYSVKLEAMLDAAEQTLGPLPDVHWYRPRGGLYVWLQLPAEIDTGPDGKLFDRAVERGVLYVPGQFCFPGNGAAVQRNTIRLSFGVQSCEQIARGMQCLAAAVEDVMNGAV